jgi:hypothetical protein
MPMNVAPRRIENGRHDADHLTVHRDQRTAGVAWIDRGIELDEFGEYALALGERNSRLSPETTPADTDGPMPNGILRRRRRRPV